MARCSRRGDSTLLSQMLIPTGALAQQTPAPTSIGSSNQTKTPIQHVIVIIGENRTFDHVFAPTSRPSGQTVDNLSPRNRPGRRNARTQLRARHTELGGRQNRDSYQISPGSKFALSVLPTPLVGGPTTPFFSNVGTAEGGKRVWLHDYYQYLTTGGTGLPAWHARHPHQKTSSTWLPAPSSSPRQHPYDAYANSPVHRFYQMWQQLDCNVNYCYAWNPSGCQADLFPWVEVTVGAGTNGQSAPSPFTD